jgi:hypothetical protein
MNQPLKLQPDTCSFLWLISCQAREFVTLTHISYLPHKHLITIGTYFTDAIIEQLEIEDVGEFTVLEQI